MTKKIVLVLAMLSCLMRAGTVHAQTPAPDVSPLPRRPPRPAVSARSLTRISRRP